MQKYLNLIDGEWLPAKSGAVFQNINPAYRREVVSEFPHSDAEDTARAIEAAQRAFPSWSATTSVASGRILGKVSQILESRKSELAELLTREEGKTLAESTGEVQRSADIFRFFS